MWWLLACQGDKSEDSPRSDQDEDGFSVSQGDCDDLDETRYPGASDVAGDGIDSDCDGSDLLSSPIADQPSVTTLVPNEQLDFGFSLATGDLDGDGADEVLVGSQDIDGYVQGEGQASLFDGQLQLLATWAGEDSEHPFAWLGLWVGMGDLSDDGALDLTLLAFDRIYVLTGTPKSHVLQGSEIFEVSIGGDLVLRQELLEVDLTGEGADELVTTGIKVAGDEELPGIWILQGPLNGPRDLSEPDILLQGLDYSTALAAYDADADGVNDLALGQAKSGEQEAGQVFLLLGPQQPGTHPIAEADVYWEAENPRDWLGEEMQPAGDLDGDGIEELAISAMAWPAGERQGRVYVLELDTPALESAELVVDGEAGVQHLGRAMVAGDFDGDGQGDLALGAPSISTLDASKPGHLLLFRGPLSGHLTAADAHHSWVGEQPGDMLGSALARGDLNGDGMLDLVVSAIRTEEEDVTDVGRVYLLPGPL